MCLKNQTNKIGKIRFSFDFISVGQLKKIELKGWEAAQSVWCALRRWKTLTSERARGATSGEIGFPFWQILFFPFWQILFFPFWQILFFPFWQILLALSSPLTPLTPSFEGGCTDNEWPPFFTDEKCSEEEGQAGDCWLLSLGGDEREVSWETPFASLQ